MGLNGYQLYVRSDDPEAVERAIRAYVKEHGADSIVNPDADKPSPDLAERERRTFAIAPPVNGTIAVWEDGSWSDRRMAGYLSEALRTEAIWLMLNDVTDSWAYARYEDGREVERAHDEPRDLYGSASEFAAEHDLPYAFAYLEDPNEDADYAAFQKELDAEGGVFGGEDFDPGEIEVEVERGVVDLPDEDERPDDDEDEMVKAQRALDDVRGDLREFAIDVD